MVAGCDASSASSMRWIGRGTGRASTGRCSSPRSRGGTTPAMPPVGRSVSSSSSRGPSRGQDRPEKFFDFTSTRPRPSSTTTGCADRWQHRGLCLAGPVTAATFCSDRRRAAAAVADVLRQVTGWRSSRRRLVVTLGALVAEVPHSRPMPVDGAATDHDLSTELGLQPSTYQGPTGVTGVLSAACREAGLQAASLWAAVPTYVPGAVAQGGLALVQHTARVLEVWVPPPISRPRRPPTSGRSASWSTRTRRRPTTSASWKSATSDEGTSAGGDLIEEVERFLRDRPDRP